MKMRAIALSIAAVLMIGFVGGCGGTGPSDAELATQDKAVQLANRLSAIQKRVVQARRLVVKERRNERLAAIRARRSVVPRVRVVRASGFQASTLCGPIRPGGNGAEARRLRKQRERARRQALYYLNLSCPRRS